MQTHRPYKLTLPFAPMVFPGEFQCLKFWKVKMSSHQNFVIWDKNGTTDLGLPFLPVAWKHGLWANPDCTVLDEDMGFVSWCSSHLLMNRNYAHRGNKAQLQANLVRGLHKGTAGAMRAWIPWLQKAEAGSRVGKAQLQELGTEPAPGEERGFVHAHRSWRLIFLYPLLSVIGIQSLELLPVVASTSGSLWCPIKICCFS